MVKWVKIGDLGTIIRGNGLQKKDFTSNGVGCIHYGQIYTRLGFSLDKPLTYVDGDLASKLTSVSFGDLVIACTSENVEDVCKAVVWLGKEDIVTGSHSCVFKHKQNPKYIAYCFKTSDFFNQKKKYAIGAKVIDISKTNLENILLPIPSLEEQQRIVDILDKFEGMVENVEKELELRQKQYEYCRDKLFDFKEKDNIEVCTIGDLSRLVTKQTGFDYSSKIKPALTNVKSNSNIPFLQTRNFTGKLFDYKTEYYVPNETVKEFPKITLDERCVLLSIVGASIGNVGLFDAKVKCFLGGAICVVKPKKETNIDYLYYYLCSWKGQNLIRSKTKGAGQATVTIEDIREFAIELPPLETQNAVVAKLDKFEAIITNLKRELELRKKQYEYYREKLLTFE